MKKQLNLHLILFLVLMLNSYALSQTPDWLWAKRAGGTSGDNGMAIAVDGDGNSYVTGRFTGTSSFNGTSLTSAGYTDIFVAKYNSSGAFLWVKRAGGTGFTTATGADIAVDGFGNCYVTGWFSETVSFNGTSLTFAGGNDIFVAKYNSSGDFLWVKQAGGTGNDIGWGIAVDASGNSYVTGLFAGPTGGLRKSYVTNSFTSGTANFDGTILTSAGKDDIFVAKYDASGSFQWVKQAGGISNDGGNGIVIDGSGNSYVTGYFTDTANFSGISLTSAGETDIFVVKYNSSGAVQWTKRAGGTDYDKGYGVAIDGTLKSYVTGYFYDTASFNPSLTSAGDNDIFVAKLGTTDTDGDGIPDGDEDKDPKDRDGDGIDNKDDFDPSGWIYDETNGNIISGGTISVSPTTGVTIIHNGSSGYYQFTASQAGNYTLFYTPPSGFLLSTNCAVQSGTFDATPPPPNPYVMGLGSKNGATNQMTNWDCGDNPYYWTFHLEPGDQLVINNNIPLTPQPTNVELSAFSATVEENQVIISWTTESELNNAGFNVFRSKSENSGYEKINETMIQARGDATSGATYTYVDMPDEAGNYYYKLQDVSLDGNTGFHGPIFMGLTSVQFKKYIIPKVFSLSQNFPNPFNPSTTVEFGLPKSGKVEITIYDIRGRLVRHLLTEQRRAGYHWVKWDSRDNSNNPVSSGIYFYNIRVVDPVNGSTSFIFVKKMTLIK